MKPKDDSKLTRRQALARIGLSPAAIYLAPTVLALSSAAFASEASGGDAGDEGDEGASGASGASSPSAPSPSGPPSPSSTEEEDEKSTDRCHSEVSATSGGGSLSISADDFQRAQVSVDAGYAKPLSLIWQDIVDQYPGHIISVSFTGYRYRPRYRLKAVSPSGRLETVIVSAKTGQIERIVGC